eukprot:6189482-Alexandrium_andersonii.AAC.1
MVVERAGPRRPPPGPSRDTVDCPRCDVGRVSDAARGGNGTHRWINCWPRNRRMATQRRRGAAQAW